MTIEIYCYFVQEDHPASAAPECHSTIPYIGPSDLIQKEDMLEQGLHFLPKPVLPQTLLRMVRAVLDQ